MKKAEYLDWEYDYSYETVQAIAIVFKLSFGEACKYGLDDMADDDYEEVMRVRSKLQSGELKYHSTESLPYI